jgi:hypothetical protein
LNLGSGYRCLYNMAGLIDVHHLFARCASHRTT